MKSIPPSASPRRKTIRCTQVFVAVLFLVTSDVSADTEDEILTAFDNATRNLYGNTVSISGDVAVTWSREGLVLSGTTTVYVFRDTGSAWIEEAKLAVPGYTGVKEVTIDGDLILVGDISDDDNGQSAGAAYVYRYNGSTWVEEAKLIASDGTPFDRFGTSVRLSGDYAFVGAQGAFNGVADTGAVYVFEYDGTNWVEFAKLVTPNIIGNDAGFGESISVSGDVLAIGAQWDRALGTSAGAAFAFRFNGTSWVEEAKLFGSDTSSSDEFGGAVSVDGDTILVGARNATPDGFGHDGAAYVFKYNGSIWVEEAKIVASDPNSSDEFGSDVTVSGTRAVIAAKAHNHVGSGVNVGAVYVFDYDGTNWIETQELIANDATDNDKLGGSIALSDDTIFAGAYWDDEAGYQAGSAYFFRFNGATWIEESKHLNAADAVGDMLGGSVAIFDDIALAGASGDSDNGDSSGAVFVFRNDGATGWTEGPKLLASDGEAADSFGHSVSIYGDSLLVGAIGDDDGGLDAGAVYPFDGQSGSWIEQAKLTASDSGPNDGFGHAISVWNNSAAVGAVGDDEKAADAGAVYLFEFDQNQWVEDAKLLAPDGDALDAFGSSVSRSGTRVIVGAPGDDDQGPSSGSAHIFRFVAGSWQHEAKLIGSEVNGLEQFGHAVAIDGNVALIGAVGSYPATAYVFRFDGAAWVEEAQLSPSGSVFESSNQFGASVSLVGNFALVGMSSGYRHPFGRTDAAFLFQYNQQQNQWVQVRKFEASDGGRDDLLGSAAAMHGSTILVGSPGNNEEGDEAGVAYLFSHDLVVQVPSLQSTGTALLCAFVGLTAIRSFRSKHTP